MDCEITGDIYRHVETGEQYEALGMGVIEATKQTAVIYQSMRTGDVWIRPVTEFFDGRFECIHQSKS